MPDNNSEQRPKAGEASVLPSNHTPPCTRWDNERISNLRLNSGDVHVWYTALAVADERLMHCEGLLSPDEAQRARTFRFSRDRDRFIAVHGFLREVLAACLTIDPRDIAFRHARHGKPYLDHPTNLHFNLSHAGEMGLVAVSAGREVGVDIEPLRPELDSLEIAEQWFTRREVARLKSLPEADRPTLFARYWVRKEAILKALGIGVSGLIETNAEAPPYGWTLYDLPVPHSYAAAIAIANS